ncbi:MAG: tetratricopeptide repeat protein [Bacteroidales bacterium]|jgi:tetratricopeptide (TPR) repeat protein|nr:tetratricopeptide repeat protein [Bacteroidales bacterium]
MVKTSGHTRKKRIVFAKTASSLLLAVGVSCSAQKIATHTPPPVFTEQQRLDYEHDFMEGIKSKLMGDFPNAANLLTRCTEMNPGDATAYFALSEIYTIVNDRPAALKNARFAVQHDAKNVWYKLHLAGLYATGQKTDSAIQVYRDIIALQPDNPDMKFDMVILYLENKQYKQAIRELKKIERTYGFTEEVAIAQYRIYSAKKDVKATEKTLLKGIEKYPYELRFYGLLAELYSSVGKERKAQENYQKLLEVDPENALGYISMIEFYKDYGNEKRVLEEMRRMYNMKTINPDIKVELYLSLAADSVFFGKYVAELDSMIAQLAAKNPDNLRVRMVNADRNLRQKDFAAAKDDMLFLTEKVTTNIFLWEQLLYLLNFLQDNEALLESSAKALQHFDNSYLFNFFHGMAASALKKYDEAIVSYNRTLECMAKEKSPDKDVELQAYVFLGEAYNEQKTYAASDNAFEKALSIAPDNALVLNNYSYYLSLREEKLDVAEQYIKKCLAIEPASNTYLDTYGWVLYKLGRIDEAIAVIEKVIRNGGNDNPEIVNHLCELLVRAGRMEEADRVCRQALEMENNSTATVEQKINSFKQHKAD